MRYVALVALAMASTGQSFILDSSCNNYKSMLEPMLVSAFDLAQAGKDLIKDMDPSKKPQMTRARSAKKTLANQVFDVFDDQAPLSIKADREKVWERVDQVLGKILAFDKNSDGSPSEPPAQPVITGQLPKGDRIRSQPDWQKYATLTPDDVVIYCGIKRFEYNKDCDGKDAPGEACDRTIGLTMPVKGPRGDMVADCQERPKDKKGLVGPETGFGHRVAKVTN